MTENPPLKITVRPELVAAVRAAMSCLRPPAENTNETAAELIGARQRKESE